MRSYIVLMTPEGETVIPVEVREHLGIPGGESLEFVIRDDGSVEVRSSIELLEEVFGEGEVIIPQPPVVELETEVEEAMSLYEGDDLTRGFSC